MSDVTAVLDSAYAGAVGAVRDIGDGEWRPTGCAGWSVRDLVFHLLGDAQRALVALATPAGAEPGTDAVSYWESWRPGTAEALADLRMTRIGASVYSTFPPLLDGYEETTRAVVHAARHTDPGLVVRTQGHTIRVEDLVRTLIVETAVHHLDLVVALDRPGPPAAALRTVRETLDALLGEATPVTWDDAAYARVGTGRAPLTADERLVLGPLADRFPLFG
jgi:uncharacterized protein (TIGR03083 family)